METPRPTPLCRHVALALLASMASLLAAGVAVSATTPEAHAAPRPSQEPPMKIRLIVGGQIATATLYDNATARDFASLLTLSDYDVIERVANLPRKLSTQGAPEGMAPVTGELTHYAPWGNLAIFVRPRSYSRSLLPLGKVDEGLSILAQHGPYPVRIERFEP